MAGVIHKDNPRYSAHAKGEARDKAAKDAAEKAAKEAAAKPAKSENK